MRKWQIIQKHACVSLVVGTYVFFWQSSYCKQFYILFTQCFCKENNKQLTLASQLFESVQFHFWCIVIIILTQRWSVRNRSEYSVFTYTKRILMCNEQLVCLVWHIFAISRTPFQQLLSIWWIKTHSLWYIEQKYEDPPHSQPNGKSITELQVVMHNNPSIQQYVTWFFKKCPYTSAY